MDPAKKPEVPEEMAKRRSLINKDIEKRKSEE
jgi:hypothetical protein